LWVELKILLPACVSTISHLLHKLHP
jgi:hypothetical protein